MTTIDSAAVVTNSPIVYASVPPALSAFFGRIGGVGETEMTTRAIFAAGWRSNGVPMARAANGISTFMDSRARRH